jgi:hypothetical protein
MKNVIVRGIKIKIVPEVAEADYPALGLYQNIDGTQEIRWSEAPVVAAVQTWTSGILCQIGSISRRLNTEGGGAQEDYSGLSIVVSNGDRLILKLKELGIILNGKTAELWEFEGTNTDSDSVSAVTQFVGTASYELNSAWDERFWNIEIKNNRYRRNAFFGTLVNNDPVNGSYPLATDDVAGGIVPATFGKFQIEADGRVNPAKFLRTAGKQRTLINSGLSSGGKYFTPIDQSIFPVLGNFVGVTTAGTKAISFVGCADKLAVGDHIKIWTGFPDGADKEITDITLDMVTVDGSNATSSTLTFIDFLHKDGEDISPAPCYVLQLGLDEVGALPGIAYEDWPVNDMLGFMESLLNKWLQVIEGGAADNTSLIGKYKRISKFQLFHLEYDQMLVTVAVESFFEKTLSGASGAGGTNQAWVSICDIPFVFSGDTWPIAGFLDSTGNILPETAKALELYAYKSDDSFLERKQYDTDPDTGKLIITSSMSPIGFKKLAPYGYEAVSSSDRNYIIINAMMFDGDPSQLLSFDIFPLINLAKYISDTLIAWGKPTYQSVAGSNLYLVTLTGATVGTNTDISGNAWCDKDDVASLSLSIILSRTPDDIQEFFAAYSAKIDIDKIVNEYNSYFLGINCFTMSGQSGETNFSNAKTHIRWRRFNGVSHEILLDANGDKYYDLYPGGGNIINLPDFYYLNRANPDYNSAFFYEKALSAQDRKVSGYKLFPLQGISSVNQLKSILDIGFLFGTYSGGYNTIHKQIHFNELALICQMSASISSELFALCAGRIFDDTWGTRKTAADMIVNPVDFIEHFTRLQWGGDVGDIVEYGKAYCPNIPIKTGADAGLDNGSFDSAVLDEAKTFSPSWQVVDKEAAYTDVQIGSLCKTFDLCGYTDLNGNACLTTMELTDPAETILFTDIIGKIGKTQEPSIQNIYVQPYFNYGYNQGSKKFDRTLAVANVQAAAYLPGYTPGIDNTLFLLDPLEVTPDGEFVWNACRVLYLKYGQIEPCPSSFSNQKMLTKYEDALKVFYKKIIGQARLRQSLSVSYGKGRYYHPGKHVKIKLPHQTLNLSIEVLIEEVKIGGYDDPVDLQVLLLEDVPTAFFFE